MSEDPFTLWISRPLGVKDERSDRKSPLFIDKRYYQNLVKKTSTKRTLTKRRNLTNR